MSEVSEKYDYRKEKNKFYVTLLFTVLVYGSILFGLTFGNPFLVIFGIGVILFLIFYTVFLRLLDEIITPQKIE